MSNAPTTSPSTLQEAFSLFQQGKLAEAMAMCQQCLTQTGDSPQLRHLAGMIALKANQKDVAQSHFTHGLALDPNHLGLLNDTGVLFKQMEKLGEAQQLLQKALTLAPESPILHSNLGNVYRQQQRFEEAKACYDTALKLDPKTMDAWVNLGQLHLNCGQPESAIQAGQQALAINPQHVSAHNVLGNAFFKTQRPAEALSHFETALTLDPNRAETLNNLGNIHQAQGALEKAHTYFQQAVKCNPHYAEAYNNLGLLAMAAGQPETALRFYEKAFTIRPTLVDSLVNMGTTYQGQWHIDKARACYDKALALAPQNDGIRLRRLLLIPPFFNTTAEILQCRQTLHHELQSLKSQPLTLDSPVHQVGATPFYLAYHGLNDVELQRDFGAVFANALGHNKVTVPYHRNPKPRIGFVSAYLYPGHTIGKLNINLIETLSRETFDVMVFHLGRPGHQDFSDSVTQYTLPTGDLQPACKTIAQAQPDVLFYTDIGMDATGYFLAFNRLASVQCATWGHPMTSGCSEIDYFISSKLYETEDAQNHYLEKLVLLDDLNTVYTRPKASPKKDPTFNRAHYGLADVKHLYLCPQTLFKLHPEFDAILAGILRGDPDGTLVLLEGSDPQWKQPLLERFSASMPDVLARIRFIPKMSRQEFINLLALSDVMLDPIHFGGGNTSLEALAQGTPIVTLPSDYLRARLTYGFYQKMGLMDCVADSPERYIQIALKLGMDPKHRKALQKQILAKCGVLYHQTTCARELETFLLDAIQAAQPQR